MLTIYRQSVHDAGGKLSRIGVFGEIDGELSSVSIAGRNSDITVVGFYYRV